MAHSQAGLGLRFLGIMDQPTAWLEFPSGERIFLNGICTLGRGPDNRVVIASERVSRRHAVIRQNVEGGYAVMDMGSSNGTYLNGQRLIRSTDLRDGWIVEIGSQKMTFRTPPQLNAEASEAEIRESDCWLLVIAGAQRGCRTPSQDLVDKTFESWGERCQRVIAKSRGRTMRGLDDTLLAFWAGGAAEAGAVASALASLRNWQKQTEEFRFALHYGRARLRRTAIGEEAPSGPEVILTMQLDKLASTFNCPVLVTESASEQLGAALPTRRLSAEELRDYRGTMRFFTPVGS